LVTKIWWQSERGEWGKWRRSTPWARRRRGQLEEVGDEEEKAETRDEKKKVAVTVVKAMTSLTKEDMRGSAKKSKRCAVSPGAGRMARTGWRRTRVAGIGETSLAVGEGNNEEALD
jgi:hypothetical protein